MKLTILLILSLGLVSVICLVSITAYYSNETNNAQYEPETNNAQYEPYENHPDYDCIIDNNKKICKLKSNTLEKIYEPAKIPPPANSNSIESEKDKNIQRLFESKSDFESKSVKHKADKAPKHDQPKLEFVWNYRGVDNTSDNTLLEIVGIMVNTWDPDGSKLDRPDSTINWLVLHNSDVWKKTGNSDDLNNRYFDVQLKISTYNENTLFSWLVDMKEKKIYPNNELAEDVLQVLEDYSQ